MEFSDQPNFTVAGVTDWTAVGGHGSDAILRTSEDLARETLTLKAQNAVAGITGASESKLRADVDKAPASFEANHALGEFYLQTGRYKEAIPALQVAYRVDPASESNACDLARAYEQAGEYKEARALVRALLASKDAADLHRLAGEIDEKLGDPLSAVREDEQAVHLAPTEQNYFAWGSELLLHRAVWQAADVFRSGAKAYPASSRMLTALGAAQFAGALYDEAATHLCAASDLDPADPEPYLFMGKIELAAPQPLACIKPKLARFVQQQPGNAVANYLYAMAIAKEQDATKKPQVETLLRKAVDLDPHCVDAYLQLGILASTQRDNAGAIAYFKKAIEVNPEMGEAHYRLGVLYDRTGEPAKAKEQFRLHDEIVKRDEAAVESQRREIKQFVVTLPAERGQTAVQ